MKLTALANPVIFAEQILQVVPHAGQAAYMMDAHPVRVLVGGRRAGKSLALALDLAWNLVRARIEGVPYRVLLTAPVLDQARLLLAQVARVLRRSAVGGLITSERESPFPELALSPEVVLLVRSTGEGGQHLRGHGALQAVVVDEAGFMSEAIIQEAITPMLADSGGRLTLASTPSVRGGLLHRYFERGKDPNESRIRSIHLRTLDNPHVDHQFVLAQREEVTSQVWEAEYEGQFTDSTNGIFSWADVVACTAALAPEPTYRGTVIGFDPAKARDGSAVVGLETLETPRRVVYLDDLSTQDYTRQVEKVAQLARRFHVAKVVIDATGGGAVLVDMLRAAGTWVEPIIFTAAQKSALVMALALAFEKRELVLPPDHRLMEELRWFQGVQTTAGHVRYEAPPGRRDDFVCALSLALLGAGATKPRSLADEGVLPILTSGTAPLLHISGRSAGRDYYVARPGELDESFWDDPGWLWR